MEQISKYFSQYKDYYYITEQGELYNSQLDKYIRAIKNRPHLYYLVCKDGTREHIGVKELYRAIYNKNFCIDNIEDLQGEEWRYIPNTNDLYMCSNKGRIKSLQRYEAIIMKPTYQKGYERVEIVRDGVPLSYFVHNLVAITWLDRPQTTLELEIHHKDYKRDNNSIDNLEYLTRQEHKRKHRERENIENVCA